jgi:hypothetical protein
MMRMKLLFCITILVSAFYASPLWAAGGLSVDAKFDLTGDGIVDAADWVKMNKETKKAYAYSSVRALGEDPDAIIEGEQTRGERYLQGLQSVYE